MQNGVLCISLLWASIKLYPVPQLQWCLCNASDHVKPYTCSLLLISGFGAIPFSPPSSFHQCTSFLSFTTLLEITLDSHFLPTDSPFFCSCNPYLHSVVIECILYFSSCLFVNVPSCLMSISTTCCGEEQKERIRTVPFPPGVYELLAKKRLTLLNQSKGN